MRIDELEKYLESVLASDLSIRASQEKSVAVNNMLAACRNLLSLENICNSETLNDNYKFFMSSTIASFSNSYVVAAQRRLYELGIGGGGFYQQPTMAQPIQPTVPPFYTPNTPVQPVMQTPIMQQPMQNIPPVQPMMQQTVVQPQSVQPIAQQPAMQQPVYAQPQQPVSQPAPTVTPSAPSQPVQQQSAPVQEPVSKPAPVVNEQPAQPVQTNQNTVQEVANEPEEEEEDNSASSSSFDFTAGLPGMGGGNDGPAEGRDYLLNLLSKKNK